jgi:hypothetical protein
MPQGDDASRGVVVTARGLSLRKVAGALWLARRGRRRGAETSSVTYQDSIGLLVFVVLLSGAGELALVDVLLDAPWMRVLALTLGLLGIFGMLSLIVALRAYPHRSEKGTLTIHHGACFELTIPLELVATVAVRKRMINQKRIAEVSDGVLSVPVMGVTNLVITLVSPIKARLKKTGEATVREIQVFAVDPGSGAQKLLNGGRTGDGDEVTGSPARRPLWARALRWIGPLVLLVEIVLVTTGLLDWRVAAGIVVVTEGILTVLGVAAAAALVSQYRRGRAEGATRTDSFSEAFLFLMPPSMGQVVRKEVAFLRVLALALAFRTERARPGDVPLVYGGSSRKALLGVALLLLAAATSVLVGLGSGLPGRVLGILLLYAAVLTTAVGLASKVRPHVLRDGYLLVRWGLHHELALPLGSVRAIDLGGRQRGRRRAEAASDEFTVPASGRDLVVVRLGEPVAAPTRLGHQRLAQTILLPVDEAAHAAVAIAALLGVRVEGLAPETSIPS